MTQNWNLSNFTFTPRADSAESLQSGWVVYRNSIIQAFGGNDVIRGIRITKGYGIQLRKHAQLKSGDGNDSLTGEGNQRGLLIDGELLTGSGTDAVTGRSTQRVGINIGGSIQTASGNDILIGTGVNRGILNNGNLKTGRGADLIQGQANRQGIKSRGTIQTGAGPDTINSLQGSLKNLGRIETGTGDDLVRSNVLVNRGRMFTGDGDDKIITQEKIINSRWKRRKIETGAGADTVQASAFLGRCTIDMGSSRDTLIGFVGQGGEPGSFRGGRGKDTLLLTDGTYRINGGRITLLGSGRTMNTESFERIGGGAGGLFRFSDGRLTVKNGEAIALL